MLADSWEDEADLDEEFAALEAMYWDRFSKQSDKYFQLHLVEKDFRARLDCSISDEYPRTSPKASISVEHADHIRGSRLEHACENRLAEWLATNSGEPCLVELANAFFQVMQDLAAKDNDVLAEMVGASSPASQKNGTLEDGMQKAIVTVSSSPFDNEHHEKLAPPPGDLVDTYRIFPYVIKSSGMQGFSARSYGLQGESAYMTPDGRCITWRPSGKGGSWTLVGDGPLSFAELEIGEVREGFMRDFIFGVTGAQLEHCKDISTAHDLDNTVLVALSSRSPCNSLGYTNKQLWVFSDDVPTVRQLQPGDRIGLLHKTGELHVSQNGQPLLRVRTNLDAHATLVIQLLGRVTQLRMHTAGHGTIATFDQAYEQASFDRFTLYGHDVPKQDDEWTKEQCARVFNFLVQNSHLFNI